MKENVYEIKICKFCSNYNTCDHSKYKVKQINDTRDAVTLTICARNVN